MGFDGLEDIFLCVGSEDLNKPSNKLFLEMFLDVFSGVPVEENFLLAIECVFEDLTDFFGGLGAEIFDGLLEWLSEGSWFLVDGLHFMVEVCKDLMHLFLLVMLDIFTELVHNVILGFALLF